MLQAGVLICAKHWETTSEGVLGVSVERATPAMGNMFKIVRFREVMCIIERKRERERNSVYKYNMTKYHETFPTASLNQIIGNMFSLPPPAGFRAYMVAGYDNHASETVRLLICCVNRTSL